MPRKFLLSCLSILVGILVMLKISVMLSDTRRFPHFAIDTDGNSQDVVLEKCLKRPTRPELLLYKDVFHLMSESFNVFLYSAHYDDREEVAKVRILTVIDRERPQIWNLRCLFWHDGKGPPEVVPVQKKAIPLWGQRIAPRDSSSFIINCPVEGKVPIAVSLASKHYLQKCDMKVTNILPVEGNDLTGNEEKQSFALCLKAMNFNDAKIVPNLVEWIELLLLLGVRQIFFHYYNLHSEILKVFDYYQRRELVNLKQMTWVGNESSQDLLNILHRQERSRFVKQENIVREDCFWRQRHRYKYIAFLDTDEVIMPLKHSSWDDMMADLERLSSQENPTHFAFHNVYFFGPPDNQTKEVDSIPGFMHMLRTTKRARLDTGTQAPKSIVKTDSGVVIMNQHQPQLCVNNETMEQCRPFWVDTNLAYSAHYRNSCQPLVALYNGCKMYTDDTITDKAIHRFQKPLVKRVEHVLKNLNIKT